MYPLIFLFSDKKIFICLSYLTNINLKIMLQILALSLLFSLSAGLLIFGQGYDKSSAYGAYQKNWALVEKNGLKAVIDKDGNEVNLWGCE
jgi:hypothetical protein